MSEEKIQYAKKHLSEHIKQAGIALTSEQAERLQKLIQRQAE